MSVDTLEPPNSNICQGLRIVRLSLACSLEDMRDVAEQNLYIEHVCQSHWESQADLGRVIDRMGAQ